MQLNTQISFTLSEWLSLTGLVQCVLILVYTTLRVQEWKKTILVIGYFFILGCSFFAQFSLRLDIFHDYIKLGQCFLWMLNPPLSYLLILQVAKTRVPSGQEFWILLLVPFAIFLSLFIRDLGGVCPVGNALCDDLYNWLYWVSSITGIFATLLIWVHKDIFGDLWRDKISHDKYWLVITLILANVGIIAVNLVRATEGINQSDADSIILIMGILFAYLATTTMFRVYPPPIVLYDMPNIARYKKELTEEEVLIGKKIRKTIEDGKLYQDNKFNRAALARELRLPESIVSRVINMTYNKSFPMVINEYRVNDAKRMLQNSTDAVNVIAYKVGFSSIATFNRIFKELEGVSPTDYRNNIV